jgi:hypothetical protein
MDPAAAFYLVLMNVAGDFPTPKMVDGPYSHSQCSVIYDRLIREDGPSLALLGEIWQCDTYELTAKAMAFNRCSIKHGPTPSPDGGKLMSPDCLGPQLNGNQLAPPPPTVTKPPT